MIGVFTFEIKPVIPSSKFVLPPMLLEQSKSPALILSVPLDILALGKEKLIELLSARAWVQNKIKITFNQFI
jgi:hypothetical protein